jgi:UPF0755 protein
VLKKGIFIGVLLVFIAGFLALWSNHEVKSVLKAPVINQEDVFVTVETGDTFSHLLNQLIHAGVIEHSSWLDLISRLEPQLAHIKAGTYQITPNISLKEAIDLVGSGKEYQFSVTLVDGEHFQAWLKALDDQPYMEHKTESMTQAQIAQTLGADHSNLEGLLLPNTYYYTAGDTDLSVLKRAYDQMQDFMKVAWANRDSKTPLDSPYQALIMASIIEKETALPSEQGLVASVFMNRLRKGMRLQTDPTVIYGLGDKYDGNITRKDLRTPTPYNTYVIFGLPPTPIAMPNKAAIMSALHPDSSPYFYFVANGKGGHTFSVTLVQHNKAVQAYLKTLK